MDCRYRSLDIYLTLGSAEDPSTAIYFTTSQFKDKMVREQHLFWSADLDEQNG
jgi:hypothetical protein